MATLTRRPLMLAVVAAVLVLVPAAWFTGATAPLALADPGAFVRWAVPVANVVVVLSSCATLGLLGVATFGMPERTDTHRRATAIRYASRAAALWSVAGLFQVVVAFADLAGTPLTEPGLLAQLRTFTWELETTRVLLISALIGAVVAIGARFAKTRPSTAWLLAFTLVGVLVVSLIGHAAGSSSHEDAVNALAFHLLGVSVWVGGLIALVLMRPLLGRDLGVTVARFSVVATWCYVTVGLSGLLSAWIRVGSLSGMFTRYGVIIVLKAVALTALGVLGWLQRRNLTERLSRDPSDGRAFARLAVSEVVLMGVASGLAAVLARSAPPVPESLPNPSIVLTLTSYEDPGPLSSADWFTAWRIDWLFLAVAVVAVGVYLAGYLTLRRRGDAWPIWRVLLWVAGWGLFVWATCGAPGIWGRVLFSMHMVMHMVVAMIIPLLLVPAAPITLALRALPPRTDRTWGPREFLLQIVHSRALRVLANPIVAASLFFFSLAAFYWTGLFQLALETHTGHLLMMGHFLLTGYLFVWVLIGIDPGVPRWSPLMLLVILFATISFHAFFGVALTGSETLLAADFFNQLQLPWMTDPLADQYTAGEIAWGIGEAPTLVLAVVVGVQWYRSELRETERKDRQADRDDDAELRAYNAHLARLREETQRQD